jgi:hypothetical protein
VSASERQKEIKRRRHRRRKMEQYKRRLEKANASEKAVIAAKLRALTPGAERIINDLELEER